MIPLQGSYGPSIASLKLLHKQCVYFKGLIMKNMKQYHLNHMHNSLLQDLLGLVSQQNKDFKLALYDSLGSVIEQIVTSITS